jgi:hypothetical protein
LYSFIPVSSFSRRFPAYRASSSVVFALAAPLARLGSQFLRNTPPVFLRLGAALFASLSRARTKLENDGERTLRRAPSVVVVVLRRIRDGC